MNMMMKLTNINHRKDDTVLTQEDIWESSGDGRNNKEDNQRMASMC